MRYLRAIAFLGVVLGAATGAWAQYGLSGAPELLRMGPEGYDRGVPPAYLTRATGMGDPGEGYAGAQAFYPGPQPTLAPPVQPPPYYPSTNPYYPPTNGSRVRPVAAPNHATASARSMGPYDPRYTYAPASPPGPALPVAPIPLSTPSAAPPPQASVMNEMLDESGMWGAPAYVGPSCGGAGYGGAGCGAGPACEGPECACFRPQWYVSAAGLFMTRDKANCLWTTYETDNNPNQLMRFNDAKVDWRGGFEVKLGRRFGQCNQWAVEGDYWRIDGYDGFASSSIPGGTVSTPLIVSDIEFGGINGTAYFDGAAVHRIWRRNQFENVEINLIRNPVDPSADCMVDLHWLLGVRYFRFDESLIFGSETVDPEYAYLSDRIYNNLIGVQVGLEAGYRLGYKWRAFAATKLGIYNNHVENTFDAYRGDGVHAVPTPASGMTGQFPVVADTDTFAFLGQIDVGLDWQFHPQWRAFGGYRLLAATGMGLADHQFLTYVVDLPEYARIKTNGNLLLHGAFAGVEFRF